MAASPFTPQQNIQTGSWFDFDSNRECPRVVDRVEVSVRTELTQKQGRNYLKRNMWPLF